MDEDPRVVDGRVPVAVRIRGVLDRCVQYSRADNVHRKSEGAPPANVVSRRVPCLAREIRHLIRRAIRLGLSPTCSPSDPYPPLPAPASMAAPRPTTHTRVPA